MHARTAVTYLLLCAILTLTGCATAPLASRPLDPRLLLTPYVLLGENHDAPTHRQLAADVVLATAGAGKLRALALEMAEQGRSTEGLPANSPPERVRQALAWDESAWPWLVYGDLVMSAVRAGATVAGANLPRQRIREAMRDDRLDSAVPSAARQTHLANVREGHCFLLPESQIGPMARVQIARDQAMADTLRTWQAGAQAGQVVILLSGAVHADQRIGVPLHLPPGSSLSVLMHAGGSGERLPGYDLVWPSPSLPDKDHCADIPAAMRSKPQP